MTTEAQTLTQPDVARLMGLLDSRQIKALIRAIESEARAGRISWEPFRRQPDSFGPSLALQLRNGRRLSAKQINAAKGKLLQRNWTQVVHVLVRDLVVIPDAILDRARDNGLAAPTYTASRGASTTAVPARSVPERRRAPVVTPQPVAASTPPAPVQAVCGRQLAYSRQTCILPRGHSGGHIGANTRAPAPPVADVDAAIASLGTPKAPTLPPVRPEAPVSDDAQFQRFALVFEAAFDESPAPALPEPELDPSVARFQLLDLD